VLSLGVHSDYPANNSYTYEWRYATRHSRASLLSAASGEAGSPRGPESSRKPRSTAAPNRRRTSASPPLLAPTRRRTRGACRPLPLPHRDALARAKPPHLLPKRQRRALLHGVLVEVARKRDVHPPCQPCGEDVVVAVVVEGRWARRRLAGVDYAPSAASPTRGSLRRPAHRTRSCQSPPGPCTRSGSYPAATRSVPVRRVRARVPSAFLRS